MICNSMEKNRYCTYLTIYFGDKLPRRYIGSTKITRIKAGYNGSVSSKKWGSIYREEQTKNKHLFRTRILTVHETDTEARLEELRLQKKYNVVRDNSYFNESFSRPNGYFGRDVSGQNNPMYGKIHPNKGKHINSGLPGDKNPMYGLKGSEHPAYGYKRSNETNKRTSDSLKGVSKTDSHKENLKKAKSSDEYLRKVNRPIYVCGVKYDSIKMAIKTSGKTHNFIWTRLKKADNTEVYYA